MCCAASCSCTVILDGKVVWACIIKMSRVPENAAVTTLEGIGTPSCLHPLQHSWIYHGAAQCGFCTPGLILTAVEIVGTGKAYSREQLKKLISGHLCRCTGYESILNAMERIAGENRDKTITNHNQ